jgi:hypothetical protein
VGFIDFESKIFEKLRKIASKKAISIEKVEVAILSLTNYTNGLLQLPSNSTEYRISAIEYDTFNVFYQSIHEDLPDTEIPIFQVAGTVNLKDADVPGYVAFSLPTAFVEDSQNRYTGLEFLVIAAHQRAARYVLKETIIGRVYEKARADYYDRWSLSKSENVEALILYALNTELIPLQETVTYAFSYLVEAFLQAEFPWLTKLRLPLVERDFEASAKNISHHFFTKQFMDADTDRVNPNEARKRIAAAMTVIQMLTDRFPQICDAFLHSYRAAKSQVETQSYDFFQIISDSLDSTFHKYGVASLRALYDRELAKL